MRDSVMETNYCPWCMAPRKAEEENCPKCGRAAKDYIPQPHHLQPGTLLQDRYLVGGVLGEGGFGITYVGLDRRLERKVAIKEYYPKDKANRDATVSVAVTGPVGPQARSYEKGLRKFLREARIMDQMEKQPSIVSVRDFFEENNTAYIVMEFVEGVTLKELVEQRGHIPPGELLPMLKPLFGALGAFHRTGLIHRDISPDNIMVEDGRVRLLDFGCAREVEGNETQTVTLKHGYAPMEQYGQGGQGTWTDVYALSATIYYCLTGVVPPRAPDRMMGGELLLPTKLGVALTETEEKALLRGMSLTPQERFQTMEDLHDALYEGLFPEEKEERRRREEEERERRRQEEERRRAEEEKKRLAAEEKARQEEEKRKAAEEKKQRAELARQQKKENPKKGKLPVILAVAAALVLAVGAALVFGGRGGKPAEGPGPLPASAATDTPKNEPEPTPSEAADAPKNETAPESAPAPGSGERIDPNSFSGAVTVSGACSREELQELMDDADVKAVALRPGAKVWLNTPEGGPFLVNKPIWVDEGAVLEANSLTVTETGKLLVDGRLSCRGLITLEGGGTRLALNAGLDPDTRRDMVVVMDEGGNLFLKDSSLAESMSGQLLVRPQRPENVISVTTLEELLKANRAGADISVDADIEILTEELSMEGVRLWVSEGVTFGAPYGYSGKLQLSGGTQLINEGTVRGGLTFDGECVFYNYGSFYANMFSGLTARGKAAMVNYGEIYNLTAAFSFFDDSRLLNQGSATLGNVTVLGASLINLGEMQVEKEWGYGRVLLQNDPIVLNSGTFSLLAGTMLDGDGLVENMGGLLDVSQEDSTCFGALYIYNQNGTVRSGSHPEFGPSVSGPVFGSGTLDIDGENGRMFSSTAEPSGLPAEYVEASDAGSLNSALQSGGAVYLTGDVELTQALSVRVPLYIGGSLSAPSVTVTGGPIILLEGASLKTGELRLPQTGAGAERRAELRVEAGASLTVEKLLEMKSAVLYGTGGSVDLRGATVTAENDAVFSLTRMEKLALDDARLAISGNASGMLSCRETLSAAGLELTFNEGHLSIPGNMAFSGCKIDLETAYSDLRMTGASVELRDCAAENAEGCELIWDNSFLSLTGRTTIVNRGFIFLGDSSNTGVNDANGLEAGEEASITNYGEIGMYTTNVKVGKPIDNQGRVVGNGVVACVGNKPTWE